MQYPSDGGWSRPASLLVPGLALVLLVPLLALLPAAHAETKDERPWDKQPFLGLSVRDTPKGLVVGWISPGPLGGLGTTSSSGIRRGDNVVSLDGETLTQEGFKKAVAAHKPGDTVILKTRRSPMADKDGGIPEGGAGGNEETHRVVLATRAAWSGTVKRGLGDRRIPDAEAGTIEALVLEAAGTAGIRQGREGSGGGLDALMTHLGERQQEALDSNSLPAVVQCFRHPLRLDAVEGAIGARAEAARSGDIQAVLALVRSVLDLRPEDPQITEAMGEPAAGLSASAKQGLIRWCGQHLEDGRSRQLRHKTERLLRALRTDIYIYNEQAEDHISAIREVGDRIETMLFLSIAMLRHGPHAWRAQAAGHAADAPLKDVPAEVRALVPKGDVLWHGKDALGNLSVVGGKGPNEYNMSMIGAVYDVGGDDRYRYDALPPMQHVPLRIVIDLKGNDVHESHADFQGPATGVFGLSWLEDHAGNDVYRSSKGFSVAAGLVGLGILVDHAGHDTYENRGEGAGWAIGAGFWGAGLLIDRGGHDVYRGEKLCEGVGGPRGFGAILESGGRDLYVANGPAFPSAYATPGVYLGMSQGFGFGVRSYAAGGVGAIYDWGGNDRYEAGEFSQAGGYYWGLGILHDAKGHDVYYGNRYGQAFAAHQAVGVLIDDEGDDTYWSMTAASQGGTWDESIGLLLDRKGNDSYRCDGLGQGGASMQAIALLVDLEGDDRYSAAKGSTQGEGGGNAYHYDATKLFSFSALFDLGGGRDSYRADRKNDTTKTTGTFREKKPASSSLYGLFVDR